MRKTNFFLEKYDGKKFVINLPNRYLNWGRIITFSVVFVIITNFLLLLVDLSYPNILYQEVPLILSFTVLSVGEILIVIKLLKEIFQRPILVLTPNRIYCGKKILFRSSSLADSGINTKNDMKIVIVQDSVLKQFRVMLEERYLIQLGIY
ncbi:MAG: hypothetical protein ACXAC8_09770 [Candidatus Hodarchaeales archaeon]|jgi:hypothetical protein